MNTINTIEFPGLLNLKLTINRVAFSVFGVNIYWYGIIIAFAFFISVMLAMKNSNQYDISKDDVVDATLYSSIIAIVCARLYYVAFRWESFKDNPIEIINIRQGGLAIYGGIIGALLAAYIYTRIKKINSLNFIDFSVIYIVLGQAVGRWGNFVNQEAFGRNTTMPWGMTSETVREELLLITGANPIMPVHPTFLYESLWDIAVFFVLMWFIKRKKTDGEVFFLYMILYGLGRFWIESLRTDSLMLGSFRISQLLALVFVVAFSCLFFIRRRKGKALEYKNTGDA